MNAKSYRNRENARVLLNMLSDPAIMIDVKEQMERVFINLINNGVDAMPKGGTMTISCKQINSRFEISFADTGVGIPEEIRSKLFSPLVTTKAQGMGFGLAICNRIIEAHGGTITVETAKGKGTTFMVTLPIEHGSEVGGGKVWINVQESLLSTMMKA